MIEIDGLLHRLRTKVILDLCGRAAGINDDTRGLGLEGIAREEDVMAIGRKGYSFVWG
jgi:hypothetical protein